jgi:tRNA threonylcarbamoyladenosine biosynthesis protein TsaB
MATLAFDTCFGAVSVALRWKSARGEWLLREVYDELQVGHAERLMPMIEEVMVGAGKTFRDLQRIAVTSGPGGFTGLRVGIAAARGFALATGVPVVAMTSLAVIAHRADLLLDARRGDRPLVVAVDARRGAVYMQVFGENVGHELSAPRCLPVGDAAAELHHQSAVCVGTGAHLVAGPGCDVQFPTLQPHARVLALLSPALTPVNPLRPVYLRAADAKPPEGQALPRAEVLSSAVISPGTNS